MGEHIYIATPTLRQFTRWGVLVKAIGMLPSVTDVLAYSDGSLDVLVRSAPPEVVTIGPSSFSMPRCTCGSSFPWSYCVHAAAAFLAIEYDAGRLDDEELARLADRAEVLSTRDASERALVHGYLDEVKNGVDSAFSDLFCDLGATKTVGLLRLVHEIAGASVSGEFATECAKRIFGSPVGEWCGDYEVGLARNLVFVPWMPPQLTKEYAAALQVIARALIRSLRLTSPEISGRVLLLQTSFEVLEEIVTAGAIDAASVADAVLCDGLAAFGPAPELFGLLAPHMGPSVCQEVGRQFDIEESLPQLDADGRRRLRTESPWVPTMATGSYSSWKIGRTRLTVS